MAIETVSGVIEFFIDNTVQRVYTKRQQASTRVRLDQLLWLYFKGADKDYRAYNLFDTEGHTLYTNLAGDVQVSEGKNFQTLPRNAGSRKEGDDNGQTET